MNRWHRFISALGATRVLSALGGLYIVLATAQVVIGIEGGTPVGNKLIIFSLIAGPGVILLYSGYRLPHIDVHWEFHSTVASWCLGGFGAMVGLMAFYGLQPTGGIGNIVQTGLILTSLSSVAGLGVGIHDARAKTRTRDVQRRNRELRRYETLIEESTGVTIVFDTDGAFQYLTPSVEHVLGYASSELVGEAAVEYVHPDDREKLQELLTTTIEHGRTPPVEFRFEHESGSWVVLEGRGRNLLDDPVIEGVVAYTHEVTERAEYERDLEQYKTVAETASDVIVTMNTESTIQSVNPAVEEIFGYRSDELVGKSLTTLMPERFRDGHRDGVQQYLATGERTLDWEYLELPGLHEDGHEIPLAISFSEFEREGEQFFTGIIRDNTERKELEAELREARDLRDRIFETSPTGILVVSSDGAVSFINEYAVELFGPPAAQIDDLDSLLQTIEVMTPEGDQDEGALFQRILSTGEAVYDVERQIIRPAGQHVWISVNGAPLHDSTGEMTAVVFTMEDITDHKRYQDRLITLNELSQRLTEAETAQNVGTLTVEMADEMLPQQVVATALYDEDRGNLQYAARTAAVTELDGDSPLFEAERDLLWQVFSDQSQTVYDDICDQTDVSESETPLGSAMIFPLGEHGVFVAGSTTTNAVSDIDASLAQMVAANTRSALDRVEREQQVREQRDTLVERTAALERVQRINSIIRGITSDLIQATAREEILQAVCDRLAAEETYRFAWVGTHDAVTDEVTPEAWAGVEDGFLETVTFSVESSAEHGPTGGAVRTQQTQIQNNLSVDPPFEQWQQAAIDRDYRACIAVPLVYQDTLYSVLTLYADQPNVFNEMEETVLTELGETIGYALNALERRQALVSDQSVELEFRLRKGNPPLFRFATEHDCEFEFENIVQRADGPPGIFFTVRGVSPGGVQAFGEESPEIEKLTLVSDRGDEALFEAQLRDSTFFSALLNRGAMPQTLTADGDEGRAVIRVPQTSSIRTFVELFEASYEGVELVGRREIDKPIKTQQEFEAEFQSQLTERQEEILRTAYVSGFFNSPREMSAQELAEMLDVSQPTVSRHIRAGERKLFGLLFDEE